MNRLRATRPDAGFTLIELLITVVILSVITLPLANFVLSYLTNYTQTQSRMSESHDIQIATAYFSQDVANTGLRDTSDGAQQSVWTTGFPAGSCASAISGTPLLLLAWDEYRWDSSTGTAPAPTVDSVAYISDANGLERAYCQGTAVAASTLQSSNTVVHNFTSATVGCPSSASACAGVPAPAIVNLTITIAADASGSTAPAPIVLSGERRQSSS
jgi:prepilin-type N-terminal cleavage/methylation domain-containing protein